MLRCLSKFGQLTTGPRFNKSVQIRKTLFVPRLLTRNASNYKGQELPFSRVYGNDGEVNSFFPKSEQKEDDFSFINSGLFSGESQPGFFTPTEDLSKKEYTTYWDLIEKFCSNFIPPFEEGHRWEVDGYWLKDGEYVKEMAEKADEPIEDATEEENDGGLFGREITEADKKRITDLAFKTIPKYHMNDVVFPTRKIIYPMHVSDEVEEFEEGIMFRYMEIDVPNRTIKFVRLDVNSNEDGGENTVKVPMKWWIHFKKVRWPQGIIIDENKFATSLSTFKFERPEDLFFSLKREQGLQKYRRVNLLLDQEKLAERQQQEEEEEEAISEEEPGLEEAVDEDVEIKKP